MNRLKTPITYYGGKQTMVSDILSLFPKDYSGYVEPFAGGAAVFFAKEPCKFEVLNDTNGELVNFYKVCKTQNEALMDKINASCYSQRLHKTACDIYNAPELFDEVTRAWALWYLSLTSFGGMLGGYFSRGKTPETVLNKPPHKLFTHKQLIKDACARLDFVTIMEYDAIKCIKDYDQEKMFFYIDPPYVGANQGHYAGYTQKDFDALLETLSHLKGKFLLSSYDNDELAECTQEQGWHSVYIDKVNRTSCRKAGEKPKTKHEVLTYNYEA